MPAGSKRWLALTVLACALGGGAAAQEGGKAETPVQEAPAPDVPGVEHAFLAKRAGEYTTTLTFRSGPDAEPEVSTGTATIEAILDDRFLCEDNTGQLMGHPFSGRRMTGFNVRSGKFETAWYYTNSTAVLVMHGESADLGRTITFAGSFVGGGEKHLPIQAVVRHIDADTFVVEMLSEAADGRRYVVLETRYERHTPEATSDDDAGE